MAWQVDPMHSYVGFAVTHMMISTVHGRFHRFSGTVEVDEGDPMRSAASGEIEVASLDTAVAERDAHLRSPDFFDVDRFPTITYRSSRIEPDGDDAYRVFGELTIRGVTREIALAVRYGGRRTDPQGKTRIGFSASGDLSRKDFGLVWNQALEAGGVMVGDTVRLEIDAEAIMQPAAVRTAEPAAVS